MLGSTIAAGLLALAVAAGGASAPGGPHEVPTSVAAPTTTAVTVAPAPQGARCVTVTVTDASGAPAAAPAGTVTLLDGGSPVAVLPLDGGTASFTTSFLDAAAAHHLSARFSPSGAYGASWSPPVDVAGPASAGGAGGNVSLVIPTGMLSITSDAEQAVDLADRGGAGRGRTTGLARVVVTDTRAGNLGFTVSARVVATPVRRHDARSGLVALVGVRAEQVPGNGLTAADVVVARGRLPRAGGPAGVVAAYPAGRGTGSVVVSGLVVGGGLARDVASVRVLWTVM